MASIFQGTPNTATDYSTTNAETPKWLQDAIYNQVQNATLAANLPYEAYKLPTVAQLSPLQIESNAKVAAAQGSWKPSFETATTGMQNLATKSTASGLTSAQSPYLRQPLVSQNLNAGQGYFNQAGAMDVGAAGQPYLNAASKTATENIGQYMNPYQANAMDALATAGARNLSEKLLPAVSDSFIKAGQFGGNRMGEFASRALRDTQEGILNEQAQMANTGYNAALAASQTDLSRLGQLGQTAGTLTNQQMTNLTNLGERQTSGGEQQQTFGLNAVQAGQTAEAADLTRQTGALTNLANLASTGQGLNMSDAASLAAAGQSQYGQNQAELDAAKAQYEASLNYPKQQLDWLSTQVRGMAPNVNPVTTATGGSTGATYSPSVLGQIASGYGVYKGLTSN
jgi:hypothetical protein